MATTQKNIRKVRRANGWAYEARWRDANGKDRQRTFPTKQQALDHKAEREHNKRMGIVQTDAESLAHYLDLWMDERARSGKCRPQTLVGYQATLDNHALTFKPFDKPVDRITTLDCEAFMRHLVDKSLSAQTIRHAYTPVANAFAIAVRHRVIATNPAQGVVMPDLGSKAKRRKKRRALSAAQQSALFEALDASDETGYDGLIAQTLLDTGVRVAELAGFNIEDYNPHARLLDINKTRTKRHGAWITAEPKSDNSIRELPIPQSLATAIDHMLETLHPDPANPQAPLFPGREPHHKQAHLAPLTAAEPWNPDRYRQVRFNRAVAAANLPPTRLHDLRHTYGTDLTKSGVPIEVVSRYMGHASIGITFDIYGHLVPKDQRHYIDQKPTARNTRPTPASGHSDNNVRRLHAV